MSNVIQDLERAQLRNVPRFKAGDTVRVHFQVIEGTRRRVQVFEGIVLKRQGAGARETFTVRKQSFGIGVERTFPLHSPKIEKIEVVAIGDVNRAKLYYLRGRVGKKARVREQRYGAGSALPQAVDGDARGDRGRADRSRPRGRRGAAVRGGGRRGRAEEPTPTEADAEEPMADEDEAPEAEVADEAEPEAAAEPEAGRRARSGSRRVTTFRQLPHARSSAAGSRAIVARVHKRTGQKLLRFDRRLGARFVAGADEAGRGSLAGPLVVAGVLLDYGSLRDHRVRPLALPQRLEAVLARAARGALPRRRRAVPSASPCA